MPVRCIAGLAALVVALGGCAAPSPEALPGDAGAEAPVAARCRPPAGVSGSPRTIAEAVTLANALPHPLALTCFLESLDRPLDAHAALSLISLQPAVGERSPRIFLFVDKLIMSVVPEGKGSSLVEMGQLISGDRSLKAELAFPLTGPVSDGYPFEHVRDGEGTTCRFCHPGEMPAPEFGEAAYSSVAFSTTSRSQVRLEGLQRERALCDEAAEPGRCALLRALFDHGDVRWKDFPPTVPTAFDRR